MTRAIVASVLVGFLLVIVGSALATPSPTPPESPSAQEARTPIEVPEQAREVVLHEMRLMMRALNGVLAGMSADDREAMARAALGGGTAIAVDRDPEMARRLPEEFAGLGQATHVAFDSLGAAIRQGADQKEVLTRLSGLTGNCVTCHEKYKLVTP